MKKVFGWALIALMLALIAVMSWSRVAHRTGLGLAAAVAMLVLILGLYIASKRRAARDPAYAAQVAKATADLKARRSGGPSGRL
jgi:hypothetical protein